MDTSWSRLLLHLRKRSGLTQEELAQRANISRRTLCNWEAGERWPRHYELQAVLRQLSVSEAERASLMEMMRHRESCTAQPCEPTWGVLPDLGEMIQSIRLGAKLDVRAAAASLGVAYSTIMRWEHGLVTPSHASLRHLSETWGASEDEYQCLLDFRESKEVHPSELDRLIARNQEIQGEMFRQDFPITSADLVNQERGLWLHARNNEKAIPHLAMAYAHRSVYLGTRGHLKEAKRYANRSLELVRNRFVPESFWMLAFWMARRTTSRPNLNRMMRWSELEMSPGLRSDLLCQLADSFEYEGQPEMAQRLLGEAEQMALNSPDPEHLRRCRISQYSLLVAQKCIDDAYQLQEGLLASSVYPFERIFLILRASHLSLIAEDRCGASRFLESAVSELTKYPDLNFKYEIDSLAAAI